MKHLKIFLLTIAISITGINNTVLAKKVLVTGGSGFLGSHLCERLLKLGHEVIAIDNLLTSKEKNITHLIDNKNLTFIKHDIIEPIDIEVDWIFNFACPASPPLYQNNPVHTLQTSVVGSINMLELARKYNARILQASTSEIYGDPHIHPQKESYWGNVNPIGIRSCYDEGKRAAETLFFDYHRQYDVDIKVIRIFNTYGPRMNPTDGRVMRNFIYKALNNEPLEVYGDGKQTRSFCYVSDLIDGIITMMKSDKEVTGPINLGNSNEMTILELAQKVIQATNSNSKIIFKSLPKDDPTKRKPDISLAKELLNWKPKIILEKGLKLYIKFIKNEG